MRVSLDNLIQSLNYIRDVIADMGSRVLAPQPIRARDETLRCACTVILSGFLESFLKDCAKLYIGEICARKIPFVNLPQKTRDKHFVEGGMLLGMKATNKARVSWIGVDHFNMADRISSTTRGKYTLLWEAYANTQGNPSSGVIESILEGLGVDKRSVRLNSKLSNNYSTLKLQLDSFIEKRNECAHTGTSLAIPTTQEVVRYCDLLEKLSRAIIEVLEERISEEPFGININTSTSSELLAIPGLGISKVNLIMGYRTNNGNFLNFADLQQLLKMNNVRFSDLRKYLHI